MQAVYIRLVDCFYAYNAGFVFFFKHCPSRSVSPGILQSVEILIGHFTLGLHFLNMVPDSSTIFDCPLLFQNESTSSLASISYLGRLHSAVTTLAQEQTRSNASLNLSLTEQRPVTDSSLLIPCKNARGDI